MREISVTASETVVDDVPELGPLRPYQPQADSAVLSARFDRARIAARSNRRPVPELAADEEGRKPGGSWRVVPLVKPLRAMLRRAWIGQGRPREGKVCPPRHHSRSGLLNLAYLQQRVHRRWQKRGLVPIGFHEARHTAATWLDHAGASPKVASQLMGHKTPAYQPGAAAITLARSSRNRSSRSRACSSSPGNVCG